MVFCSRTDVWIPLYLLIFLLLVKIYRKEAALILLMIAFMIGTSDAFTSRVIKPLVKRPRPCHEFAASLHLPDGCGGAYGFVSSHASNTFALTFFLFLLGGRSPLYLLMFIWTFTVSYSRVYLGVHYPGDVIFGSLIGMIISVIYFNIYQKLSKKYFG